MRCLEECDYTDQDGELSQICNKCRWLKPQDKGDPMQMATQSNPVRFGNVVDPKCENCGRSKKGCPCYAPKVPKSSVSQ